MVGSGLSVSHLLHRPIVTAHGKAQTVRYSKTAKPLGLVVLTMFDLDGNVVGSVQVKTVDLRAALSVRGLSA
jgi:cytoskeletal protein CcmA (bactofilin family)